MQKQPIRDFDCAFQNQPMRGEEEGNSPVERETHGPRPGPQQAGILLQPVPLLLLRAVDPAQVRRDLPRDRAAQRQGQRPVSGGEPGAARE
ncbi:hypothetical protein EUGRSUZ_C03359 [Eucalyptus grandis]|uniref:Uncharacterized protein n=2 Tax=Eucalyptus grandis TaxID=71139 RepID=A0ACC3LKD4_EUCGR|nr:hypothetical protein EUGRSUZ_C03359 [Eucalyptus grandis]